jgi:hypothetical protein
LISGLVDLAGMCDLLNDVEFDLDLRLARGAAIACDLAQIFIVILGVGLWGIR